MRLIEEFPYDTAGQAVCYICGNPKAIDHEGVMDLDRVIEFEGRLCFCLGCITEMATILGFSSPSQTARYQGQIRNLKDELEVAEGQMAAAITRVSEALGTRV